jgi:hypothetical protein
MNNLLRRTVMKKKLFWSLKRLTIGLPLAVAVCIFIGCASSGGGSSSETPGTLTITGIPEEYEGKFVSAGMTTAYNPSKGAFQVLKGVARSEHTLAANGEVKLPVTNYAPFGKKGYAGSDTLDVKIVISDPVKGEVDPEIAESRSKAGLPPMEPRTEYVGLSAAVFASVTFENGVAEANWDDAVKGGHITVTNIAVPEGYTWSERGVAPVIYIGKVTGSVIPYGTPSGNGGVINGTLAVPVLRSLDESGRYSSFSENGTVAITLKLVLTAVDRPEITRGVSGVAMDNDFFFLFTAVEITDGKAVIDFRQGIRQ